MVTEPVVVAFIIFSIFSPFVSGSHNFFNLLTSHFPGHLVQIANWRKGRDPNAFDSDLLLVATDSHCVAEKITCHW